MQFPKQNISSEIGERGLTIVKNVIEGELHWIFRKNHQEHDYGVDAYIDITTELRQVTGKTIALQIKTGQSYFKESTSIGWIYRDSIEHLNYYLNHQIPVLILLVNDIDNIVYWGLCDAIKTESAGGQWKMTIPSNNQLNINCKSLLEKYVSPIVDYASPLMNLWEQHQYLKDLGRILLMIDMQSILDNKYSEVIKGIEILKTNESLLEASQGKIDICINGYDNDKRELYEIKEVREWTNFLFENVKGLSYFLATDKGAQFLRIIEYCVLDYTFLYNYTEDGKLKRKTEIDLRKSQGFFEDLFNDLNNFCDKHSISLEKNKKISFDLFKYLTGEDLF